MINDWKKISKERDTPAFLWFFGGGEKTIFDTYLKSGPASNQEANWVTKIGFFAVV